MDKFAEDAPALARYQTLTAELGEPISKRQADMLTLLSRWISDDEVARTRGASPAGNRPGRVQAG